MSDGKLTLKIIIGTATPAAVFLSSFMPAVLGVVLAWEHSGRVPLIMTALLIAIPCLMNASVNVLNDYYDYEKGNDTNENVVSEMDGPLAFNKIKDARLVLYTGTLLIAIAAVMGIYVVYKAGIVPAVIGVIGGVIALTYSGDNIATSYLPVGEVLSGFTLGGLVPFAVYSAITGDIDITVLYKALPMMIIVSQFMISNNTCDIERDGVAGRKTLPIMIGRENAHRIAKVLNVIWLVQIFHVVLAWYGKGLPIIIAMCFFVGKSFLKTFTYKLDHENKNESTLVLAKVALGIAVGYPLALFVHLLLI